MNDEGLVDRRTRARLALRTGLTVIACGLALMALPLLLSGFAWNKYFVAFGLSALLFGLTVSFNAGLDLRRGR